MDKGTQCGKVAKAYSNTENAPKLDNYPIEVL